MNSEPDASNLAGLIAELDDPARRDAALRQLGAMKQAAAPATARLLSMLSARVNRLQWSDAVRDTLVSIGAAAAQPVIDAMRVADESELPFYLSLLTDLPDDPTAAALQAALGDPDGRLRARAIRALARRSPGSRALAPSLLALLHDPVAGVRQAAAMALGRTGTDAIAALSRVVASDPEPAAIAATEALGEVLLLARAGADHAAIEGVVLQLSEQARSGSPGPRLAAAAALHQVAGQTLDNAIAACLAGCVTNEDWLGAIVRILRLPCTFAIAHEHRWQLAARVEDPDAPNALRRGAAALLLATAGQRGSGTARAVDLLEAALLDPTDPDRTAWLEALRRAGPVCARLVPALLHHVRERDAQRCPAALRAIAATGVTSDEILDVLAAFDQRDLSPNIEAVIDVLGQYSFASARAVAILATHLDGWYGAEVAGLLARLGAQAGSAVPALADAAWRNTGRDGCYARALAEIGTPEAYEQLRTMHRQPIGNFDEWSAADAVLRQILNRSSTDGQNSSSGATLRADRPCSK